MKRINYNSSAVFAVISIIMASLVVCSFGCAKKEVKEIKIGAILPLTGDVAEWGNNTKNGIDLAEQRRCTKQDLTVLDFAIVPKMSSRTS